MRSSVPSGLFASRLLIACHEDDHAAASVIDRLQDAVERITPRLYVWRRKAGCLFGRIEPVYDNHFPVLVKGVLGLFLGGYESVEACERNKGILIVTLGSSAIPTSLASAPARGYFRGWQLDESEDIAGFRKVILLNETIDRAPGYAAKMADQAAIAIMMGLEDPALEQSVFLEPGLGRKRSPANVSPRPDP